jgi:hypothetical protein
MPIKIITITVTDCVFSISSILELDKCITRGPWWDLQVNVRYRTILVKQLFDFSLANITRKIPNVESSR